MKPRNGMDQLEYVCVHYGSTFLREHLDRQGDNTTVIPKLSRKRINEIRQSEGYKHWKDEMRRSRQIAAVMREEIMDGYSKATWDARHRVPSLGEYDQVKDRGGKAEAYFGTWYD